MTANGDLNILASLKTCKKMVQVSATHVSNAQHLNQLRVTASIGAPPVTFSSKLPSIAFYAPSFRFYFPNLIVRFVIHFYETNCSDFT